MTKQAAAQTPANQRFLFGFEVEGKIDSMWVPGSDSDTAAEVLMDRLSRRYPYSNIPSPNLLQVSA